MITSTINMVVPVGLEEDKLKWMYVNATIRARAVGIAHCVQVAAYGHHSLVVAEVDALCRQ